AVWMRRTQNGQHDSAPDQRYQSTRKVSHGGSQGQKIFPGLWTLLDSPSRLVRQVKEFDGEKRGPWNEGGNHLRWSTRQPGRTSFLVVRQSVTLSKGDPGRAPALARRRLFCRISFHP